MKKEELEAKTIVSESEVIQQARQKSAVISHRAEERRLEEWKHIQGLLDKIRSVGTGGISSDDPQAVEKLEAKLAALEKNQEMMKAANAAIRMKDPAKGDAKLAELGYTPEDIAKLRAPDFCGRIGYPAYALQNNNANMPGAPEEDDVGNDRDDDGPTETDDLPPDMGGFFG